MIANILGIPIIENTDFSLSRSRALYIGLGDKRETRNCNHFLSPSCNVLDVAILARDEFFLPLSKRMILRFLQVGRVLHS